jgi:uncharacterized protein
MGNESRFRYVLDVNTLVSAYLYPDSLPGTVLEYVLTGHSLLLSLEISNEAVEVLRRDKFDRYLVRERRDELIAATIRASVFIVTTCSVTACRDPDDNRILELAVDGGAAAVVTGDSDLLAMHPFQGISILSPRDFLAAVGN